MFVKEVVLLRFEENEVLWGVLNCEFYCVVVGSLVLERATEMDCFFGGIYLG